MANYLDLSNKSSEAGQGRLPKFRGEIGNISAITAATTLYDYNSGSYYTIQQASAFTIALPLATVKAGMEFTFILTASAANAVKINGGASNAVKGASMDVSAAINAVDNNMVQFVASGVVGSRIHLISDGSNWLCQAVDMGTNKITGTNS
tara:strand:- start:370 stop:819 length:450 start_codon:yes stop_codon:yes gene_type:complete